MNITNKELLAKEYQNIMQNYLQPQVENQTVQASPTLEDTLESIAKLSSYRNMLSIVGSTNCTKTIYLNDGTSVDVITRNGFINIHGAALNGESFNLTLTNLEPEKVMDIAQDIAKELG